MGYAEKNLAPGESIVLRARYHWTIYRVSLLLFLLGLLLAGAALYASRTSPDSGTAKPVSYVALGFLAIALISLFFRWVRANADEFVVTNRRVIRKVGLTAREIEQAPIEKIQDITVDQGLMGRMLGYGTVTIETASERGMMTFPRIERPEAFRNALWGQAPASSHPSATAPAAAAENLRPPKERLADLENLKQQGLVSEQEYAVKRREILSHL